MSERVKFFKDGDGEWFHGPGWYWNDETGWLHGPCATKLEAVRQQRAYAESL